MEEVESAEFQRVVWGFYRERGRYSLPWRVAEGDGSFDPYKIFVSEIMLQQTQVSRVILKYQEFLAKFPDTKSLSQAPLSEVLSVWSGLGYNRRAKFLWQAAQLVEHDFDGAFPNNVSKLQKLPGVGINTAGAIAAYAFNVPVAFVETNIRTVYIHHFFKGFVRHAQHSMRHSRNGGNLVKPQALAVPTGVLHGPEASGVRKQNSISDKVILDLVESTLDHTKPRTWFWALMDYGTYLKQTVGNVNRASKSYTRQSTFAGSKRQLRGQIIRSLIGGPQSVSELASVAGDARLDIVLEDLLHEKMIIKENHTYRLFA